MSLKETMTALADEVRRIRGEVDTLSISGMAEALSVVNTETVEYIPFSVPAFYGTAEEANAVYAAYSNGVGGTNEITIPDIGSGDGISSVIKGSVVKVTFNWGDSSTIPVFTAEESTNGEQNVILKTEVDESGEATLWIQINGDGAITQTGSRVNASVEYPKYFLGDTTDLTIPDGIKTLPANFFYQNNTVTAVDLNGVNVVNEFAFYNCPYLDKVRADNATYLYKQSFRYADNLTEVSLLTKNSTPNVLQIATKVFGNCPCLEKITFHSTPRYVASDAFLECTGVQTLNVAWSEDHTLGNLGIDATEINYNYEGE